MWAWLQPGLGLAWPPTAFARAVSAWAGVRACACMFVGVLGVVVRVGVRVGVGAGEDVGLGCVCVWSGCVSGCVSACV